MSWTRSTTGCTARDVVGARLPSFSFAGRWGGLLCFAVAFISSSSSSPSLNVVRDKVNVGTRGGLLFSCMKRALACIARLSWRAEGCGCLKLPIVEQVCTCNEKMLLLRTGLDRKDIRHLFGLSLMMSPGNLKIPVKFNLPCRANFLSLTLSISTVFRTIVKRAAVCTSEVWRST